MSEDAVTATATWGSPTTVAQEPPATAAAQDAAPPSSGYWYRDSAQETGPVDLLNLLRKYRDAERQMRARTRNDMGMGETDLVALRYLLRAHAAGRVVRQRELADVLEIKPASASALIDRLCRDGYAERVPHPDDRRSVAVVPTAHSDAEVRQTLGLMHRRMLEAVESLTPGEREGAALFLTALIRSVDAS
ncbi:MarR family winged helix-turn-helix transcriptional regulator [Mycetocola reblochoni]|uniref:Transcriptional regulator, MarR family n=2 Tax=Mycetocola reblochoni TaxID=331618 RepID=A0A1R4J191_9MICO|nr:MarR family winged helix-turn-helix transcriptional regulator [Mycetocola reblochoni]RLP71215.1 MarR family transcriptional regulator [Mycetocola reblochoni]SJN25817.1 Transcriptional regulator, MarR family [Mycetocola reblochoni REB411]